MSINLYQLTVPVFTQKLKCLATMLKIAEKDAKARGIDPSVILNSRLSPDMLPLISQVRIATDHAKGCCARLAAVDSPYVADEETTFAELDQRIKTVLSFIKTLKAKQFVDSESSDIAINMKMGSMGFNGMDYVTGWALPNFYFHYTTVYNILRSNGLALGKSDYLGQVPGMTATGKIAKMLNMKPVSKKSKKKK